MLPRRERRSDGERGHEVIFIVGMPRSGSTLTEQILAAHPEVEGASELPDLGHVLAERSTSVESDRFPGWVKSSGSRLATAGASAISIADRALACVEQAALHRQVPEELAVTLVRSARCCPARASSSAGEIRSKRVGPAFANFSGTASNSATRSRIWPGTKTPAPMQCRTGALFIRGASTCRITKRCSPMPNPGLARYSNPPVCISNPPASRTTKRCAACARRAQHKCANRCGRDTGRATRYGELLDPLRAALRTSGILE